MYYDENYAQFLEHTLQILECLLNDLIVQKVFNKLEEKDLKDYRGKDYIDIYTGLPRMF